jgi:hypothetical protein
MKFNETGIEKEAAMIAYRLIYTLALGVVLMLIMATRVTAQSVVHLPLLSDANGVCRLPAVDGPYAASLKPNEVTAAADTSNPHILPLGSQLGDVGQYYSQVSPSLSSVLHIANLSGAVQTFTVTLYGDTGNMVRILSACRVAARATWTVHMADGGLEFHEDDQALAPTEVCDSVIEGTDAQGFPATRLHGLYHAQIAAAKPSSLEVRVHTRPDSAYPQSRFEGEVEYEAVPGEQTGNAIALSGILATRDRANWWDTEVIVQKVSNAFVALGFKLCTGAGHCFDNNAARLAPYERRLFLASHLLYEDTLIGVVERAGWYSASVYAKGVDTTGRAARIAVAVNYFRQEVEEGALYPKSEQGSQCLYSTTPIPAQMFTIPVDGAEQWQLRIYNPSSETTRMHVRLLDSSGRPLGAWEPDVGPHGTWNIAEHDLALVSAHAGGSAEAAQNTSRNPALVLRILTDRAVSVFAWDNEGLLRPQVDTAGSDTWYAPIVAAPIVPFRWDENGGSERIQRPGAQFGLAETAPQERQLRPAWTQALNWYTFDHVERWCHEVVGPDDLSSTFIPMWHGLGKCNRFESDDRSCFNSDVRLQRIRNSLPSSCVGRPLFLANEPDLTGQASMTFHELGRLIYVLRDWPGELFSPVFASYSYEQPTYPPETSAWCRRAVTESLCPQTPGCEICHQDGVIDGKSDPYDISFKGLEDYFAEPHRWSRDQTWRFDDFIEGMLLHFYPVGTETLDDRHWRVPFLHQYRDRAAEAGWPIIVKEYGFAAIWPNEFGDWPSMNRFNIADQLDNARRYLQANLGNGEQAYGGNPFKLFWMGTGCSDPESPWEKLCLFYPPQLLTEPVGICWYEDAARSDRIDRQCGRAQSGHLQLPLLSRR